MGGRGCEAALDAASEVASSTEGYRQVAPAALASGVRLKMRELKPLLDSSHMAIEIVEPHRQTGAVTADCSARIERGRFRIDRLVCRSLFNEIRMSRG